MRFLFGVKVIHSWKLCNCFIFKCIHNWNPDLKWMGLDFTLTYYHNTLNSHQLFKPYSHWEKVKYCYICLFSINKKCGFFFVCLCAPCGMFMPHIHVLYRSALASAHQGQPLPETLSVMESTPQVRGMHTIIRYYQNLFITLLNKLAYKSHVLWIVLL